MVKTGILFVAHGSRSLENNQAMKHFVKEIASEVPCYKQKLAFLEGNEKTIADGVYDLKKAGVERIFVAPLLLFTGVHVDQDIPRAIEAIKQDEAALIFQILPPLAEANDGLLPILESRIPQANQGERMVIFLVVHGSLKYPEIFQRMHEITEKLIQQTKKRVEFGFLHDEETYLEKLAQMDFSTIDRLVICPFFLMESSFLVGKIRREVSKVLDTRSVNYEITKSLALDSRIAKGISSEIRKEIENELFG
ncbi:sirohydrochlorin chelatase [Listeria kieliensis]